MKYFDKIKKIAINVPRELVDFNEPRDTQRMPTQASSNFITNKEQGDWAENLITRAINETSTNYVAVKYGKSDNLIAGEEGFEDLFHNYQLELDSIGKRPDLLLFKKEDFNHKYGYDISNLQHDIIFDYVKKTVAGIEVRSSAFLINYINLNKMRAKNN